MASKASTNTSKAKKGSVNAIVAEAMKLPDAPTPVDFAEIATGNEAARAEVEMTDIDRAHLAHEFDVPVLATEPTQAGTEPVAPSNADPLTFDPSTLDFSEITAAPVATEADPTEPTEDELNKSSAAFASARVVEMEVEAAPVTPEVQAAPSPLVDPTDFEYVQPPAPAPTQAVAPVVAETVAGGSGYAAGRALAVEMTDAAKEGAEGVKTFRNDAIGAGAQQSTGNVQSAGDLMRAAKLDFTVEARPLFYVESIADGAPRYSQIPTHKALARTDTNAQLSIMSADYSIFQNSVLIELADAIVGADKRFRFGNAISINGGRKVALQLALRSEVVGIEKDLMVSLFNSFDGTLALSCGMSQTIIVCRNTWRHTLDDARTGFSIRHSKNGADRLKTVVDLVNAASEYDIAWNNSALALMGRKLNDLEFEALAHKLIPGDATRAKGLRESLTQAYHSAPGARPGTAWGAMQAATYYVSHDRSTRLTDGREEAEMRFESVYLGSGAKFAQSAYDVLSSDAEIEKTKLQYVSLLRK